MLARISNAQLMLEIPQLGVVLVACNACIGEILTDSPGHRNLSSAPSVVSAQFDTHGAVFHGIRS